MGWETAWTAALGTEWTGDQVFNARTVIAADVSSYDGTKIRISIPAGAGGNLVFDGTSIGEMSANDDFDSAPTRITWDTGNHGATVSASTTKVSDEITFNFDKTKRYGIHVFLETRNHAEKGGTNDAYYDYSGDDKTLVQTVSLTPYALALVVSKLEVYEDEGGVTLEVEASECE